MGRHDHSVDQDGKLGGKIRASDAVTDRIALSGLMVLAAYLAVTTARHLCALPQEHES